MSLKEYQEKRKFDETPEPTAESRQASEREPIFVVQKHDASHLHFDFRLEADGVLKSWAVPKGPSMNPKEKRLAVQVEDHPLDYAEFEGLIPEGNYGAGTVEIWDNGTYTYIEKYKDVSTAIEEGILEFKLHGGKLKGLFTLIRTNMDGKKKNWLLIKKDDPYAVHQKWEAIDIPSYEK
ncbi:MAG: 3'-phosphoesterase [Bacteroidales bacterium]|nr:3'-phosphoesterase [Bacteroidales bacterium]